MLRPVSIPDICPRTVLEAKGGGPFSLIAGDFEEIYGVALDENNDGESSAGDEEMEQAKTKQRGQWGAVVTCFFIDCVSVVTYSCALRQSRRRVTKRRGAAYRQARNVLQFLRIIHALLEEGGAWINIGKRHPSRAGSFIDLAWC
jgi:carnosine N-methyltransferase